MALQRSSWWSWLFRMSGQEDSGSQSFFWRDTVKSVRCHSHIVYKRKDSLRKTYILLVAVVHRGHRNISKSGLWTVNLCLNWTWENGIWLVWWRWKPGVIGATRWWPLLSVGLSGSPYFQTPPTIFPHKGPGTWPPTRRLEKFLTIILIYDQGSCHLHITWFIFKSVTKLYLKQNVITSTMH